MNIQIIQEDCTLCSHCLSVCPAGAIQHDGLDLLQIKWIDRGLVTPEAYESVIRGRRSIRHYKDRPVVISDPEKGRWLS